MSVVSPIPTETDLAHSPELAILASLRVAIELASETLRALHSLDGEPLENCEGAPLCAATIVCLAETLRHVVVNYEQRLARMHRR